MHKRVVQNHPEASTREGIMSERFLCGPDITQSAVSPTDSDAARFSDSATQAGLACPQLHPNEPLKQAFCHGVSTPLTEGSGSSLRLTDAEMKELEEVCSFLLLRPLFLLPIIPQFATLN